MDRTDAPNYTTGAGGIRLYQDKNAAAGIAGTQLVAADRNAQQEEMMAVILAAGLTPNATNWTQLLQAIQTLGRIKVSANLNVYVSPSGSDTANTGLSAASPFKTIQAAVNYVLGAYDFAGLYGPVINLAAGTYTAGANFFGNPVGCPGGWTVTGNPASPDSTIINVASGNAFSLSGAAQVTLFGVKLLAGGTSTPANPAGFAATLGPASQFTVGGVDFGTCSSAHIIGGSGCVFGVAPSQPSYTVSGSAPYHISMDAAGAVTISGATVTLSGTPNFSQAFLYLYGSAFANMVSTTFSGSATGQKYIVNNNGVLITGGTPSGLPGSVAGTTSTGGQAT